MLNRKYIAFFFVILFLASCSSPINRSTRFKKIPREHSLNFCGENVRGPKTDHNKEVWIVFSDTEGKYTLQNPGGVVKFKKTKFMEPFFVIKEKGEYLCLVKYDPQLNGNDLTTTKLKNRQNAQYYGWMNKADLLLSRQSVTDIATGFKSKSLSIISDTMAVAHANLFIKNDSVQTFKDDRLSIEGNKIPLHELIYTVKYSEDRKKRLMARKATVTPDSVDTEILGWLPASLTYDIGQRLYVDTDKMPNNLLSFKSKEQTDFLPVYHNEMDYSHTTYRENALKYAPVYHYNSGSNIVSFKTSLPMPLTRRNSYYVRNVNGDRITFNQFKQWEKDFRKINVIFVLEGKKLVIDSYSKVMNAIQNMQPMFDAEGDIYNYRFGAVMAFQGQNSPLIKKLDLTGSYSDLIDFINKEDEVIDQYRPLSSRNTWVGLEAATDLIYPSHSNETNILIVIGEAGDVHHDEENNGFYTEEMNQALIDKISNANVRVLGFQLHGERSTAGNNFVLQISSLIDNYANKVMQKKRSKIVYPDQIIPYNRFKERSKNIYSLDFPDNSMTQGWILFPQKDNDQPLNNLISSVDTLILDVKKDNDSMVAHLDRAFRELGKYQTQLDSLWIGYHNIGMSENKKSMIDAKYPMWYLPSQSLVFDDAMNETLDYKLLLSEDEFDDLLGFLRDISINEVDYVYKGKKKEAKDICNCPEDYIIDTPETAVEDAKFRNTKKIRKSLYNLYLKLLNDCRICTPDKNILNHYSLADVQLMITGCPSSTPQLNKYILNDIKDHKKISDGELQQLILYFKDKKENLENLLTTKQIYKFESNGENYYWISQDMLP